MKDRIKQIMDYEQLTPSAFADKLQLGRAVMSHILNGRNNPSLDVVTRILSKMSYINSDWLLTGTGKMLKSELDNENKVSSQISTSNNIQSAAPNSLDLFSQNYVSPPVSQDIPEYRKENIVEKAEKEDKNIVDETIIYKKLPERKITKIIIYYSDNTFETFNADNNPL